MRQASLIALTVILASCGGNNPGGGSGDGANNPPGGAWIAGIVGPGGLFLATGDAATFTERRRATDNDLHSLVCVGHTLGWAAGAQGTVVATIDGGVTWVTQSTPTLAALRGVSFANASDGVAVGESATLLSTGDGGNTWSAVRSPASVDLFATYASRVSTQAWAVGANGTILRSADSGRSFVSVRSGGAALRAVKFAGAARGFAVGDGGTVLATADGGASWRVLPAAPADLRGLSVSDDAQRIVAVGAAGVIWRSADGGNSWSQIASGTRARLNAIGFLDSNPDQGWAAGEAGTVLYTRDAGAHFSRVEVPVVSELESVEDL